jgi:hypothetical protein
MLLVQLPAMDNVPGLALVDRLPAFHLAARLRSFSRPLANPSLWLTILATLVILSTIRAALLFFRTTPLSSQKVGVTLIPGVGVVQVEKGARHNGTSTGSNGVMQDKQEGKNMSSALWGLILWDSLPALPLPRRNVGASDSERGRWSSHGQQEGLRIQLSQGKRPGPGFERPCMCSRHEAVTLHLILSVWNHSTRNLPIRCTSIDGQNDYVTACE